jgi:hypothetical protein
MSVVEKSPLRVLTPNRKVGPILGERYGLWLLKNSRFVKIAEIWDIEDV